MQLISLSTCTSLTLLISTAQADRLAVVAFDTSGRPTPTAEADKLAADLATRGHRIAASTDTLAKVSAENQSAGADWAAKVMQSIGGARAALTPLDRVLALNTANAVGDEIVRRGGGMGGATVLVE